MQVIIAYDDGEVCEKISIPLELEIEELELTRNIKTFLELRYELVDETIC
jgi:hypothetical protein